MSSARGPVSWSVAERRYFGVVPGGRIAASVRTRLGRLRAVARSRVRLALVVAHSRLTVARVRLPLHWEARRLEAERTRLLHALGGAAYRDDREETGRLRAQIGELEGRMEAVHDHVKQIERWEIEQIARARLEGSPTNIVPQPPGTPEPEPPLVPEPEPVPHEPPGPVIVPEPEPVPHEPPGPVIVPEPQPPAPGD
jgi:hypothetical protein